MIYHNTNDIMKNNLPRLAAKAIKHERQNAKKEIANMVAEAIQKERENIKDELSGQVTNDVANIIPSQVDSFLKDYMSNHILHVHPTSSASAFIPDLQHQLCESLSSQEMDESTPFGSSAQEELEDFDAWLNEQGIDDDEVPIDEVSPELLAEVSEKEMTSDDI
nr:hypothetical protein [Tanacetum cinerariifolium]